MPTREEALREALRDIGMVGIRDNEFTELLAGRPVDLQRRQFENPDENPQTGNDPLSGSVKLRHLPGGTLTLELFDRGHPPRIVIAG
jgi:hypothetical protein